MLLTINAASGGLSPLARGNPKTGLMPMPSKRPIPACAGEPMPVTLAAPVNWAYPRLRGGTLKPVYML